VRLGTRFSGPAPKVGLTTLPLATRDDQQARDLARDDTPCHACGFGCNLISLTYPGNPGNPGGPMRRLDVVLPDWFLLAASLLLPTLRLRRLLGDRARARAGIIPCATCGYDLRATPPGGRCPECGAEREMLKPEC
jgi:hypothetical protein